MAALTGLLILTKGLELSGAMHWLGRHLIGKVATEPAAALWLVTAAALLSTVLTNDVALFLVVPLTLGVCRISHMPATRLIVFEALAVHAGSALTPIGNPQNIFFLATVAGLLLRLCAAHAAAGGAADGAATERDRMRIQQPTGAHER